jgi:hypothetical protein
MKKSHFRKEAIHSPKKGEDANRSDHTPSWTWNLPVLGIAKWEPTTKTRENMYSRNIEHEMNIVKF